MDDAEIFAAAVEIGDRTARERYLDGVCRDAGQRARVGTLVSLHVDRPDPDFLARPLPERLPEVRRLLADAMRDDDEAEAAGDDPLVGRTIDGIALVRRVGEGGFGFVYEGHQERTGRTVAVKVMRPRLATRDLVRRFETEARLLAQLDHPGIARIHAAGTLECDGRTLPYLVMEYVANGVSITAHATAAELPVAARLRLFQQVAAAVAQAHRQGVIHRDLKPANILVDERGRAHVIDFGWGRSSRLPSARASLRTMAGQLIGTCQYMSPEQFRGDPQAVDTRSDVYSLGVILHELLAGAPPYDVSAKGLFEVATIVEREVPPSLQRIDRHIPRDVATIVATCLRKDPQERYSSAHELAADLGRHLAGEPIAASPPRAVEALRRFARRHTVAAAAIAFAFVALLGAVGAVSVLALRSEQSRRAEAAARRAEGEALQLAETRLTMARRETANARRQLFIASLYRLADLAAGSSTAAATSAFHETAALAGFERSADSVGPGAGFPIELRCLWPEIDQSLGALGGLLHSAPTDVRWSPDGRWLTAADPTGPALVFSATPPRDLSRLGHLAPCAAPAPDGSWVAIATADSLALHALPEGRVIASVPVSDDGIVLLAVRPDGRQIATAGARGLVTLWDVPGLARIGDLEGHRLRVRVLRYSPDGATLMSAGDDKSIYIRETTGGRRLHRLLGHQSPVTAGAFAPDGSVLASSDRDGLVRLWDVAHGATIAAPRQPAGGTTALEWSPDGTRVAGGSSAGHTIVWDAATGDEVARMQGHTRRVTGLAWTPDGARLASVSGDRTVRLWDPATGACTRVLKGHSDAILGVAIDPSGSMLATAGKDRTVRLWGIAALRGATVVAGDVPIVLASFAPDGKRFATATAAGTIDIYDAATLTRLHTLAPHDGPVTCLAWQPDGARITTGGADGRVIRHDPIGGGPGDDLALHPGGVTAIDLAADGLVASSGADRLVRVVGGTGAAIAFEAGGPPVRGLAFVSDGLVAVGAGRGGTAAIWPRSGGEPRQRFALSLQSTTLLAVSPDGRRFAVGGSRGQVVLADTMDGGSRLLEAHAGEVTALAFSGDGRRLSSAAIDHTVRIHDVAGVGPPLLIDGLDGTVVAVAESPRGDRLVTGSDDGIVRLWDTTDGALLATLRGHVGRVHSVAFHPGGEWLLTVGGDGTVRVWGRSEAEIFAARGK